MLLLFPWLSTSDLERICNHMDQYKLPSFTWEDETYYAVPEDHIVLGTLTDIPYEVMSDDLTNPFAPSSSTELREYLGKFTLYAKCHYCGAMTDRNWGTCWNGITAQEEGSDDVTCQKCRGSVAHAL